MAPKNKTTSKAQKKKMQQEQDQTQPEASKKAQGKQKKEEMVETPQQVSAMPSKLEVIKRRCTNPISGTPFDLKSLPDQIKRKISTSSSIGDTELWANIKDMRKKHHDHEAKWEARQRLERGPDDSQQEWEDAITKQYNEWYNDSLHINTRLCEVSRTLIKKLQQYLESGDDVPASQARTVILMAEETIANATRDNIILKAYKNKVGGEFLDAHLRAKYIDMAYVDAIIARQEVPWGGVATLKAGKRDESIQKRWSKGLFKSYGASFNGKEWCPIAREWYNCEDKKVVAAHLVPYNTGEVNCDHLFGPPDNGDDGTHLFSLSNGLPMHGDFERALDSGRIIIVPTLKGDRDPESGVEVDFENDKQPFKIQVLDRSLIDEDKGAAKHISTVLTSNLHGRFLEFKTDFRPSKRYLWFVAITTLARRRRCRVPGWTKDTEALGNNVWATPGQWLRRSTMHCIMRQIGFEERPEPLFERGPFLRGGAGETAQCREIAERVALSFSTLQDGDEESTGYISGFSEMHLTEGACTGEE